MVDMKTLTIGGTKFEIVDAEARADISSLQAAVGSPLVASTVSAMTDTSKIYVYTGSESGYTSGNWYYHNGSAWVSGGVYNAVAVSTDKTLSVEDQAADAKKTGDEIADLKSAIGDLDDLETTDKADLVSAINEATTTVQDGSITTAKLADDVKALIAESSSDDNSEIEIEYAYPTYTQNTLDSSGNPATGNAYLTNYLPVVGGEKLTLTNAVTSKVAFYTENKVFISPLVSTSSGINDYTVPSNARFARYQNVMSGGTPKPFGVRRKNQPENKNFFDLVTSPLNCNPSICITGDSNTYGYGLSNTAQAWSYLFLNTLVNMTKFIYKTQSRWCEAIGPFSYSSGYNYKSGTELSIYTDATSITLGIKSNYSSAWSWYIDGVEQISYASTATLPLDGNMHKVTARFTGGQAVDPYFEITKNITFVNKAVSGVGVYNLPIESNHDWLIVMIGTNNRSANIGSDIANTIYEYFGRGTFIVPFPNHKTDSSYTHSEMETYSHLEEAFINAHFDIINASDIAGNLFYDDSLYQSDKIHFNAEGHRRIANLVSGRMGFPLYLKSES